MAQERHYRGPRMGPTVRKSRQTPRFSCRRGGLLSPLYRGPPPGPIAKVVFESLVLLNPRLS